MSRGLSNADNRTGYQGLRNYGATNSTNSMLAGPSNMTAAGSDVTFAGFSPTEFMSLSESIAQNISAVKSGWHHLEKSSKAIGGPKDSLTLRDKV